MSMSQPLLRSVPGDASGSFSETGRAALALAEAMALTGQGGHVDQKKS